MDKAQLERVFAWFEAKPTRIRWLQGMDVFCVGCAVAAFLEQVFQFRASAPAPTIRFLLTCGIPFVLLSAARHALNRPRPYEVYDLPPLLPREGKGKSFPSRHAFSIFVIGGCYLYLLPAEGAVLLLLGVVLCAIRVLSGVHFARDVIVGAAVGILSAVLGYSAF